VPYCFQMAGLLEAEIPSARWEPGSRLPAGSSRGS
jgi:hypothetical protein